jgi:hypothetical protein
MRQGLAIAAMAAVVLLVASPAGAGSAKGPTLRSLQAQITSLQKQVKTLKKQTALAQDVGFVALAYGGCSTAVTADTFQDTFTGLEGHYTHSAAYFGTQTPLNDYGACSALEVVRAHNQNPPTTSVLAGLLDLFKPTGASGSSAFLSLPRPAGFAFSQLYRIER